MDDANKVIRIASHLKSIRLSDTVKYELLSGKDLHKFSLTTRRLKQTVFISINYLSDHTLSAILSDMDTRHAKDIMQSNDNPEAFFLDYTPSGRVIFSVVENKKYADVEVAEKIAH